MENRLERHLFPGNNTSIGFYSYYQYILPQNKANHIYCLKGGPGVGKSTFMKNIAAKLKRDGFGVEYLHCSSAPQSLDGILIPELRVALIDGTAPHIVDPINPGAVDEIINLGDYWDIHAIKRNKDAILATNAEVGHLFRTTYHYLGAAKRLMDIILSIYEMAENQSGIDLEGHHIIEKELMGKCISQVSGSERKMFASAITPSGVIHHIDTLIDSSYKVYTFSSNWGLGVSQILSRISDAAKMRGYDVELYYCPMLPKTRIEHLIIPRLKLAFFSETQYIHIDCETKIAIDLIQYTDTAKLFSHKETIDLCSWHFDILLSQAICTLEQAKCKHDEMERYYVPCMDFDRVNKKGEEVYQEIIKIRPQ